jgi:hypothetical protein
VWFVVSIAVLIGIVALVVHRGGAPKADKTPPDSPKPTIGSTDAGRPLLGESGDWVLYARAADRLLRIQPGTGRVTTTPVPVLQSTGAITFLLGTNGAIIRPLDYVAGYSVADDRQPTLLKGALGVGGLVLPGPDEHHYWVQDTTNKRMTLVDQNGRSTGTSMPVQLTGGWPYPSTDGAGYLLVNDDRGTYDVTPHAKRKISSGWPIAVGAGRWLVADCPTKSRCQNVVVNPATGARRVLPGPAAANVFIPGVISPDGSAAAVVRMTGDHLTLHLIDLTSGADRTLNVPLADTSYDGAIAWSPDGRWLFAAADRGWLAVIDPNTGNTRSLGIDLPPIIQLAVRPSTSGR